MDSMIYSSAGKEAPAKPLVSPFSFRVLLRVLRKAHLYLFAAFVTYTIFFYDPKKLLLLVGILLTAKFNLLRPLMVARSKAGDYARDGKATARDFLRSIVPRNEAHLYSVVSYCIALYFFVSGFHFRSVFLVNFTQGWHFLFATQLVAMALQCVGFAALVMRYEIFYRIQVASLALLLATQVLAALIMPGHSSLLSLAQSVAVLMFWILAFLMSTWRMRSSFFPLSVSRSMRPKAFPPRQPGRFRIALVKPTSGMDESPFSRRQTLFPSVLPMVAATVPSHWDVMIFDEVHNEIDYDLDVDVIGITTMSLYFPSAREIAEKYRKRGVTVIFGGPDATRYPEQYLSHGDSVLVGEAFDFFPTMLKDWEEGKLKALYKNPRNHDLTNLPRPRNDLVPAMRYNNFHTILVSTSCPFACEYCTYAKSRMTRLRPVDDLVAAVEESKAKFFWFEAPELLAYKPYVKKLSVALKDKGIHWATHASMKSSSDPENLKNAYQSGLRSVNIGVESFSQEAIDFVNKRANTVSEYLNVFNLLDKVGISANVHVMFGFPQDKLEHYKFGLELLIKGKAARVMPHPLGVYEGDKAFEDKLVRTGGVQVDVYRHYNEEMKYNFIFYRPSQFSDTAYAAYMEEFLFSFYSWPSILKRILLRSPRNFPNLVPDLWTNIVQKFQKQTHSGHSFYFFEFMDQLFRLPKGEAKRTALMLEAKNATQLLIAQAATPEPKAPREEAAVATAT
jgi:hypothetical protein